MNKTSLLDIERSIIKRYRKDIWAPFNRAIDDFNLINENDKIAVAISGGKDSLLLAKALIQYQKIGKVNFKLEFIVMDPGFNKESLDLLKQNCIDLNIPVNIKKSDVFAVTKKISSKNPCYMCARMRRGFLYNLAKELECNKLALGHHFDDVIETTLLNILYGSQFKTMIPKVQAENFEDMILIRPMIYIQEKDIIRWANYSKIDYKNCGCSLINSSEDTKRKEIKQLIAKLEKDNPNVKVSIFKSATNVNINQIYGYSTNGTKLEFNEIFNNICKYMCYNYSEIKKWRHIMRELVIEVIEKLEEIRKHRVEERGVLTRLMEDDVIVAIENLTNVLVENYLQPE